MRLRTEPKYTVNIGSRKELNENKVRPTPYEENRINVWTDGSGTQNGAGSSYYIRNQNIKAQEYLHLGDNATVYQAEITAVTRAAIKLLEIEVRTKQYTFILTIKES